MLKCVVCGTEFPAIEEMHYIARDNKEIGLSVQIGSTKEEKIYDAYDCPMYGSQIIAKERKRLMEPMDITKYLEDEK